jgi:hypothetical protein
VSKPGPRTPSLMPVFCAVASRAVPFNKPHHAQAPQSPVGNDLLNHLLFSAQGTGGVRRSESMHAWNQNNVPDESSIRCGLVYGLHQQSAPRPCATVARSDRPSQPPPGLGVLCRLCVTASVSERARCLNDVPSACPLHCSLVHGCRPRSTPRPRVTITRSSQTSRHLPFWVPGTGVSEAVRESEYARCPNDLARAFTLRCCTEQGPRLPFTPHLCV